MRALLRGTAPAGLVLVGSLLALPPGSAMAVELVPPGNSAANQYSETLPATGGNMPSSEVNGDRSPARVLGAANAKRLEALGPEGRAAARLATATAPRPVTEGRSYQRKAPLPAGSSGLGEVLRQITGTAGSGGMGALLPLVIALALVGAVAFALARRYSQNSA